MFDVICSLTTCFIKFTQLLRHLVSIFRLFTSLISINSHALIVWGMLLRENLNWNIKIRLTSLIFINQLFQLLLIIEHLGLIFIGAMLNFLNSLILLVNMFSNKHTFRLLMVILMSVFDMTLRCYQFLRFRWVNAVYE